MVGLENPLHIAIVLIVVLMVFGAKRLPELRSQIKGLLDIDASVDSPEAAALRDKMNKLPQDQVKSFMEDLELFGNYIHGTHVAGIASEGSWRFSRHAAQASG